MHDHEYLDSFKKGDLIKFTYVYDRTSSEIGVLLKVAKDLNFYKIFTVFTGEVIDEIPATIIHIKKLNNEKRCSR